MSILFSDNFNSGFLTGWDTIDPGLGTRDFWGVTGTYCVSCSASLPKQATKFVDLQGSVGALRMQVSALLGVGTVPTDGKALCQFADISGISDNQFQCLVYIRPDGSFRCQFNHHFTPFFVDSAAGLFPVDGSPFGLQIRFEIGTTNHVIFEVNDIDVATVNDVWTPFAIQWNTVAIYNSTIGPTGAKTTIYNIDNFEVDDSNASVSWPTASMPTLMPNACDASPGSNVTGLTYDCFRQTFTVTSDGDFTPPTDTVTLTGPGGAKTVSIFTDGESEIVFTISEPFQNGEYTVTVNGDDFTITLFCPASYSGLYKIVPGKTNDTVYYPPGTSSTTDVKIP